MLGARASPPADYQHYSDGYNQARTPAFPAPRPRIQSTKFKNQGRSARFFAPPIPFRYTLALSLRCEWDFIVTILF